jgi:hypothetical protein
MLSIQTDFSCEQTMILKMYMRKKAAFNKETLMRNYSNIYLYSTGSLCKTKTMIGKNNRKNLRVTQYRVQPLYSLTTM